MTASRFQREAKRCGRVPQVSVMQGTAMRLAAIRCCC
nr:MAG TPA: hypothetical protein [Caudoviricetes sp.]